MGKTKTKTIIPLEEICRVEIKGKRFYEVKQNGIVIGAFPSVTSILGTTSDKTALIKWAKRIGQEEADAVGTRATDRGTVMHRLCELYLMTACDLGQRERLDIMLMQVNSDEELKKFDPRALIVGTQLFFNLYGTGFFERIKQVISQEKFLWNQLLLNGEDLSYAGTVDNFSLMDDDTLKVIDFKTAKKAKQEKWIEGYKMQVAAYSIAIWKRMGMKPMGCEIWISNEVDRYPQCFMLNFNDITEYFKLFLERRKQFNKIIETL